MYEQALTLLTTSSINSGSSTDQIRFLNCIQVLGCDMHKEYLATLFRFPLRTPDQAASSRISKQVRGGLTDHSRQLG